MKAENINQGQRQRPPLHPFYDPELNSARHAEEYGKFAWLKENFFFPCDMLDSLMSIRRYECSCRTPKVSELFHEALGASLTSLGRSPCMLHIKSRKPLPMARKTGRNGGKRIFTSSGVLNSVLECPKLRLKLSYFLAYTGIAILQTGRRRKL